VERIRVRDIRELVTRPGERYRDDERGSYAYECE
jgi:hypothetical protein